MTRLFLSFLDEKSLPQNPADNRKAQSEVAAHLALYAGAATFPAYEFTAVSHYESGQPYFKENEQISLSISHTPAAVAVAVSEHLIGIDIEKEVPLRENVMRRICNRHERVFVERSQNPGRAFLEVWTFKESIAKATGEGMKLGLTTPVCDQHGLAYNLTDKNGQVWRLKTYEQIPEFIVSVCSGEKSLPTEIIVVEGHNFMT